MEDRFYRYLEYKIKCEEDLVTSYKATLPYIKGQENIRQIEETILLLESSIEIYKEIFEKYKENMLNVKYVYVQEVDDATR